MPSGNVIQSCTQIRFRLLARLITFALPRRSGFSNRRAGLAEQGDVLSALPGHRKTEYGRRAKLKKRSYTGAVLGFLLVVVAPTLIAAYYYMTIHVDRYVVELRYSVRGGAMLQAAGESGLTQGATGALVFAADSFVLEDYIASVQAFEDIERRLPDLRQMLGKDGGDPIRRYDPDLPAEDMLPFWQGAVRPRFDAITGITTVDVSFYTPEDAQAVATALVSDLNELADSLSRDARTEMLTYVNDQFNLAVEELRGARSAVEDFRRQNRTFSPDEEVTAESRISAELSQQLTEKRLELRTLRQRAPNSPRLPTLRDEIDALQAQIIAQFEERDRQRHPLVPAGGV